MSAFVVADETINRVITFVADLDWLRRDIYRQTNFNLSQYAGRLELGKAMFQMNCEAVEQRYGKGEAEKFRPLDYTYCVFPTTAIQAYKSLGCFLYQCSEGDVPETAALYKTLQGVEADIARHIVSNLPQYDQAKWD